VDSNGTAASAIKGSIYFLVMSWFSTGINFLINILLARILFPEDFGISSISFTVIGIFSMFIGFGLGPGVIQSQKEKDRLFSTFFFIELATTILISSLIFGLSGIFANIFMDSRIQLTIQVLTLYTFLLGFNSIPKTYLMKELQFKKVTIIESSSVILNLISSLILALLLKSYWSLICGPIIAIIFRAFAYWISVPVFPKISKFDREIFRILIKFALPILSASIVIFWATHIDDMVVAQILGLTSLGLYSLAFKISNYLATLISHPISTAMYPIYCKIQDDKIKLQAAFEQNYKRVLTITVFITFYILINAEFIISVLFGDKWLVSIPILQILVFEGFLRSLASITGSVFQAINKYYWIFITSIIYLAIMAPIMIISTIYFGLFGTAISVTIIYIPIFLISYLLLRKYIKFNILRDSIIRLLGAFLTIPPMLLILYYLIDYPLLILTFNLLVALAVYSLFVNYCTKGEFWKEIKDIINIILKRENSKENYRS